MSYVVRIQSTIVAADTLNTVKHEFKLPLTELRDGTETFYPSSISTVYAAGSTNELSLVPLGSKLKLLAVKSTRPVEIVLIAASLIEYAQPPSTYHIYMSDTLEDELESIETLRIIVPAEPVTAPDPAPPLYPEARVEILVVLEETPAP